MKRQLLMKSSHPIPVVALGRARRFLIFLAGRLSFVDEYGQPHVILNEWRHYRFCPGGQSGGR